MVNNFQRLSEGEEDFQIEGQTISLQSPKEPSEKQKNGYIHFIHKNVQKLILFMVLLYLIILIINLLVCRQPTLSFQVLKDQPKNLNLNNGMKKQNSVTHFEEASPLSTQIRDNANENAKQSIYFQQKIQDENEKTDLRVEVEEQIFPVKFTEEKQTKTLIQQEQQLNDRSEKLKNPSEVASQSYRNFILDLEERKQKLNQQIKNKKINQIYQTLQDHKHSSIHALAYTELSSIITSYRQQLEKQLNPLDFISQNLQLNPSKTNLDSQYFSELNEQYSFSSLPQKSICVILATRNNVFNDQIQHSLNSIYSQQYQQYQVVIADRNSHDLTYSTVHKYFQTHPSLLSKTKIMRTDSESEAYALWSASRFCEPDSIGIYLDGNTQLIGKEVFNLINFYFSESPYNIVYANYFSLDVSMSKLSLVHAEPYDESESFMLLYRSLPGKYGKMMSFRVNAITNIPEDTIKFNNKYFTYSSISSIASSLLEISCGKIKAIDLPLSFSMVDSLIEKAEEKERRHELRLISQIPKIDIC